MMKATDKLSAPSRGNAENLMTFFEDYATRKPLHRLDEVLLYIKTLYEIAPKVKLDASIVLAQALHETGWFTSEWWENRLNPAGLGITGVPAQNEASHYFEDGEAAAKAHLAHLSLYAFGNIPNPLTNDDNPRYNAFRSKYGETAQAESLQDLAGKWAMDSGYGDKVASKGNELFQNLADQTPFPSNKPQPSVLRIGGAEWDGRGSIRVNGILFRSTNFRTVATIDDVNLRVFATTQSPILRTVSYGTELRTLGWVIGEKVQGENRWWVLDDFSRVWVGGTGARP